MNIDTNSQRLDRLIKARTNPITSMTMDASINAIGSVIPNAQYQITPNSPMSMLNPQINGPMNLPSIVNTKYNYPTKYNNKRRNTTDQIALYDWRNNTSLNNSTKVPANYYQEQLAKKAKDKVITKQMAAGYSTQYANSQIKTFNEFSNDAIDKINNYNEKYNASELQMKDGNFILNYSNGVEIPSYNPLLPKSKQNYPINDPSYPDERMTHYVGERPYTTKGDRQLQARELATSEKMKERRQLQAESEQALWGTPKAPRKDNPNIGMGIKTQFYDDDEIIADNKTKNKNEKIKNIKDIDGNYSEKIIENTIQHNQKMNQDEIRESYKEFWEHQPNLNLYSGRSSDLTKQRSKLQQQQEIEYNKYFDESRNKIFKNSYRNQNYDENENYENKGFLKTLYEGFLSLFGISPNKETYKHRFKNEEDFEDELKFDNSIYNSHYDEISEYTKEQNRHKYWVIKDDTKFEFNDEMKHAKKIIKEPISMLTDGEKIYRTMVQRTVDSIKVHQREENLETGEIKYNFMNIPLNLIKDENLKQNINLENRHKVESEFDDRYKDILELTYEDHLKFNYLIDEGPDDWKIETKKPMTYYQRELADDYNKNHIISNIGFIDEYLNSNFTKESDSNKYFEKFKIDNKTVNKETFDGEFRYDLSDKTKFDYSTNADSEYKMGIKQDLRLDPRKITSRFNE